MPRSTNITPQQAVNYITIRSPSPAAWNALLAFFLGGGWLGLLKITRQTLVRGVVPVYQSSSDQSGADLRHNGGGVRQEGLSRARGRGDG